MNLGETMSPSMALFDPGFEPTWDSAELAREEDDLLPFQFVKNTAMLNGTCFRENSKTDS